jgi:hypothetical protein
LEHSYAKLCGDDALLKCHIKADGLRLDTTGKEYFFAKVENLTEENK